MDGETAAPPRTIWCDRTIRAGTHIRRKSCAATLSARREQLEAKNASLWNSFKGLETYQAEGRTYLLTPAGQQIVHAGKVGQRDAWEVVRR